MSNGVWIPKFPYPLSTVPTLGYYMRRFEFASRIPIFTKGVPLVNLVTYAYLSYKIGRELRGKYNEYVDDSVDGDDNGSS